MKLNKISYLTDKWALEGVSFEKLNLVVGKNATGKSRLLSVIKGFAEMIKNDNLIFTGEWDVSFEINDKNEFYDFSISKLPAFKSPHEILNKSIDGKSSNLLIRNDTSAKIFSEQSKDFIFINPPDDKLSLHTRRDTKDYPYFEDIVKWAEGVHFFNFGNIHSYSFLENNTKPTRLTSVDEIGELIKDLDTNTRKNIITEFNSLGYNLESFDLEKVSANSDRYELFVKEQNIRNIFNQRFMSQGMFRAFYLVVFINYLLEKHIPSTIIIDDLGEGLDYDRSTKMGIWLFSKLKNTEIQLIATSNDYFMMDAIDLNYWNLLKRNGERIISINQKSNPKEFENFKFSGLSNFDFFGSDFLLKNKL
jgi:predicted ATP-dependent endonuclease of OLD family